MFLPSIWLSLCFSSSMNRFIAPFVLSVTTKNVAVYVRISTGSPHKRRVCLFVCLKYKEMNGL